MKSLTVLGLVIFLFFGPNLYAAEKVKLGSAIKTTANYYLPVAAAEDQGFWKEAGLEVEWSPFAGTATLVRAVAAGAISIGLNPMVGNLQAAGRGVPVVVVSELVGKVDWFLWVRADSRIRSEQDVKGARIGVPQLGGTGYGYGMLMVKALGLSPKDVRFVGTGGIREELAALRTGTVDGIIEPLTITLKLKVAGQVREGVNISQYLPREWLDHVVFATRGMIKDQTDLVGRVVKGVLRATNFARGNRAWAIEKMKSFEGLSEREAVLLFDQHVILKFTTEGKMDRKAVENVRNFLVEYGIISAEKTPPAEELFTRQFTG